ncbi:hypothetical protein HHI36_006171 [Cryptolaemus montrouzieri]|uniref:Uncharacterized protein n=1 Tax=Cryptolaemus montrouzieri TaxID=559131 RepID=A0ABD2NX82_9CUCU
MVSFGTSKGPIIPRSAYPPSPISRSDAPSQPAPVYETSEDLPNPSTYKPLIPHQYRTKLYAVKPPTNLILGTPLDIKYTPSQEKYDVYKKTQLKSLGRTYSGPNLFERQPYEFADGQNRKTFLQPSVSYVKPQVFEKKLSNANSVPEIGIVYSSGVRYYVPQVFYQVYLQEPNVQNESEQENSVYEKEDQKYFYKI